jgi:hypothetical protein
MIFATLPEKQAQALLSALQHQFFDPWITFELFPAFEEGKVDLEADIPIEYETCDRIKSFIQGYLSCSARTSFDPAELELIRESVALRIGDLQMLLPAFGSREGREHISKGIATLNALLAKIPE